MRIQSKNSIKENEYFKTYKKSSCVIDKCGVQPFLYLKDFKFLEEFKNFLHKNKIDLITVDTYIPELTFQDYIGCTPTLFSCNLSYTSGTSLNGMVLSQVSGTVTLKDLDPSGIDLIQLKLDEVDQVLWNSSYFMTNSKHKMDQQLILLARQSLDNVFVLTSDSKLLDQLKLESIKCLRPIDVLKWMVLERFISKRKGLAIFKKWRKSNYVNNVLKFSNI